MLVYGTNWGDAHNRLNVIAYSFGPHKLEEIWSRTALPGGHIEIGPGGFELSFYTTLDNFQRTERTETYLVTKGGIHLRSAANSKVE